MQRNETRLIRLPEVKRRVGLSRSSIYDLTSRGEFPKACSLGDRAIAWLESDIDAWIAAKVEAGRKNKSEAA